MLFKSTVELLLSGHVICETAYPDQFAYLQEFDNHEQVSRYLEMLERRLSHLESAEAYYSTFTKIDSSNQSALLHLFGDLRSHFRPLVELLDLLLTATDADLPLRARQNINLNSLFEPFEHDQTLRAHLRRLTSAKPFKTNKLEPREQLVTLFARLEEMGYLVRKHSNSSRYYATARFDLIHLLIEFLNDAELIELPEQAQAEQGELLF